MIHNFISHRLHKIPPYLSVSLTGYCMNKICCTFAASSLSVRFSHTAPLRFGGWKHIFVLICFLRQYCVSYVSFAWNELYDVDVNKYTNLQMIIPMKLRELYTIRFPFEICLLKSSLVTLKPYLLKPISPLRLVRTFGSSGLQHSEAIRSAYCTQLTQTIGWITQFNNF